MKWMITMADLTQEVFDSLPESVQENYELSGDVYVTKDSLRVSALKGSLDKAYGERDTLRGEMTAAESLKAEQIATAKEEALQEALAKNDGVEATRLLQEKLEDAERRAGETADKYKARLEGIAKDKESVIISELSLQATPSGKAAFSALIKNFIKVDADTGIETFFNEDGSASSLDKEQFTASLPAWDLFKPLLKAELPTNGGGQSNGSQGGSASLPVPSKMTTAQRIEFKKRDPAAFKLAFNLT